MGSDSWLVQFLVTRGQVFDLWNACTLFLTCLTIISGQLGKMKVPRVHENSQKSNTSIFSNFHDPGYMKIHIHQMLRFSSIFMTWKSTKIRRFNFVQFSWPWVRENSQKLDASIFFNFHDPGYMKIQKNQRLWFSSTFMTPGTWKSTKIGRFNFVQFSWPRVHENHKNQTL